MIDKRKNKIFNGEKESAHEMVYQTFSWKYGIEIDPSRTHIYNYTLSNYENTNHIECFPKTDGDLQVLWNREIVMLKKEEIQNLKFVFKSFEDGFHLPSFGLEAEDAPHVKFDYCEVDIFNKSRLCGGHLSFNSRDKRNKIAA